MSWLPAVVAALSVVTVFNTLLCFAVIRRLRDGMPPAQAAPPDLDGPAPGTAHVCSSIAWCMWGSISVRRCMNSLFGANAVELIPPRSDDDAAAP